MQVTIRQNRDNPEISLKGSVAPRAGAVERVLVTYGDGNAVGVLADGYLPTVKRMSTRLGEVLGSRFDEEIDRAAHRGRDFMFWYAMIRCVGRQPSDYLDMFYFSPLAQVQEPKYPAIRREAELDRSPPANRSLVFIYYNRQNESVIDVPGAINHARQGIAEAGVRIKAEERYQRPEDFKQEATKLLEELVEPYVAPCLVLEERLNGAGFRGSPIRMSPIHMQPLWKPRRPSR